MRKNFWNHKLKNMMIIFLSAAVSFSSAAGMSLKSYAADEQQGNEGETNENNDSTGENNNTEESNGTGENNNENENNDSNENNDNVDNNENNENNESAEEDTAEGENNNEENASNDEADDNESNTNDNDAGEENESDEAGNSDETDNSTSNNDDNNLGDETENNENAQSEENNGTPESAASAPVEPTKPEIEGELDNDKIRQYNQEAENYNQQVDDYNKAIDEEYEQALIDTEKRNEEIEANNQAELEKAKEVQQENERLQAQYEEALVQYEKDLAMEEKIKAAGYDSVEQYNERINNAYNIPAKTSIEENAKEENIFEITESYDVQQAETASGNSVKVYLNHVFLHATLEEDYSYSYEEQFRYSYDFEIDENDIITFYAAGVQLKPTAPGWCAFYMNSDESHSIGYWSQAWSDFENTANNTSYGWNCGDTHTSTFKDGKLYPSDSTDTYMTYYYKWNPLKTAKTYNVPVEPTLNLVEYTPNILEKLAAPSKRSYLSHISLMDLLAEPEIIPTPDPEPVVDPEPVIIPEVTPVPEIDPIVTPIIPDPLVPTAPAPANEDTTDDDTDTTTGDEVTPFAPAAITITETPVPMAAATEEGAVLGATRDTNNEAAVLGARRASTEDTTNTSARIMILLLAAFTSITVIRKAAKNAILR